MRSANVVPVGDAIHELIEALGPVPQPIFSKKAAKPNGAEPKGYEVGELNHITFDIWTLAYQLG